MAKQFLSRLKNPIALRSWSKAGVAALAAAAPALWSFSPWAIVFCVLAYSFAFFYGRRPHESTLAVSYWSFAAFLFIGSFVISRETDFFGIFGGVQALALIAAFFVFFLIFISSSSPRVSIPEAAVHTILLLSWTLLSGFLIERFSVWWFFIFFIAIALVAHEAISRSLGESSRKTRAFALFSGFIAVELLFMLRFLPFHLIPQAIIVSVGLVIFFDIAGAHVRGGLRKTLLIEKALVFVFFLLLLGFFSKWTL